MQMMRTTSRCGPAISKSPNTLRRWSGARVGGSEVAYIHTSGHASPADLRALTKALQPKAVIPVHGQAWDEDAEGFGDVQRLF
jgi:ribonuclease J